MNREKASKGLQLGFTSLLRLRRLLLEAFIVLRQINHARQAVIFTILGTPATDLCRGTHPLTEVYRFEVSTNSLDFSTSKYRELESDAVFFAEPSKFRMILWKVFATSFGWEIKSHWMNLFKNFVFCLNMAYFDVEVFGDQIPYEQDRIAFWGRWDDAADGSPVR